MVEVFAGVLILRRIATTHMAALQAKPKVDPRVAAFQTLLATARRARLDVMNMIQMRARVHPLILYLSIDDTEPGTC
jgi:hypothetical protein